MRALILCGNTVGWRLTLTSMKAVSMTAVNGKRCVVVQFRQGVNSRAVTTSCFNVELGSRPELNSWTGQVPGPMTGVADIGSSKFVAWWPKTWTFAPSVQVTGTYCQNLALGAKWMCVLYVNCSSAKPENSAD